MDSSVGHDELVESFDGSVQSRVLRGRLWSRAAISSMPVLIVNWAWVASSAPWSQAIDFIKCFGRLWAASASSTNDKLSTHTKHLTSPGAHVVRLPEAAATADADGDTIGIHWAESADVPRKCFVPSVVVVTTQ